MGKHSKKNNTPAQKIQWQESKKLTVNSSTKVTITDSKSYTPEKKEPSKRDYHRMDSAYESNRYIYKIIMNLFYGKIGRTK